MATWFAHLLTPFFYMRQLFSVVLTSFTESLTGTAIQSSAVFHARITSLFSSLVFFPTSTRLHFLDSGTLSNLMIISFSREG
jgi:hypothetical protein